MTYGRRARVRRAAPSQRLCNGGRPAAARAAAAGRRVAGVRAAAAAPAGAARCRFGSRAPRSADVTPPGARAPRAPTARAAMHRVATHLGAPPSAPPLLCATHERFNLKLCYTLHPRPTLVYLMFGSESSAGQNSKYFYSNRPFLITFFLKTADSLAPTLPRTLYSEALRSVMTIRCQATLLRNLKILEELTNKKDTRQRKTETKR